MPCIIMITFRPKAHVMKAYHLWVLLPAEPLLCMFNAKAPALLSAASVLLSVLS